MGRLLAVQAQDPRGFRLSVRARSTGLRSADVDAALSQRRTLVVSWLCRGTLHLVEAADYWWLHPLTTPQLAAGSRTRLRQEGVSERQARRGVQVVHEAVAEGPQTRAALRERLDDAGVPTARQALVHVLLAATLAGDVVRGPVVGGEQAFVSASGWLGAPPVALPGAEALARLAERYLRGHGPASDRDLAAWAGITLGAARTGLAAIADLTVPAGTGPDGAGLVDLSGRDPASALPRPRLLGPFDPLMHGWVSREAVVGEHRGVVTSNGLFRPVALVRGRVVGTWGLADGLVTLTRLEPVAERDLAALRHEADAVLRYLGLPQRDLVIR